MGGIPVSLQFRICILLLSLHCRDSVSLEKEPGARGGQQSSSVAPWHPNLAPRTCHLSNFFHSQRQSFDTRNGTEMTLPWVIFHAVCKSYWEHIKVIQSFPQNEIHNLSMSVICEETPLFDWGRLLATHLSSDAARVTLLPSLQCSYALS